ncbi:glycerate kinase [Microbacterium sp.]|uniref:glycerate kinase n=1 Tax=Microbacterium sp. TaxID=51671 RepID=UPI003A957E41
MRIVIAVDKFKGSLTGTEVAAALTEGIASAGADIQVRTVPVADGGEGTVDAALDAGYTARSVTVTGPTGAPVDARYAVRDGRAIVELAAASGIGLLSDGALSPLTATSRGTGELIRAALDDGCTQIVLGVGGSASTDGGAGMLQALGVRLRDAAGTELGPGGAALARLAHVDVSGLDARVNQAEFVLASDVDNPLLGPRGAAAVFAPQKGATPTEVQTLEAALARWARLLQAQPGVREAAEEPGAGAAGGVGFAALAVFGARGEPGAELVQRLTGLSDEIARADLVVTGEGSLDEQSLAGKAPIGVARTAGAAGVSVVAVCGRTTLSAAQLRVVGLRRVYAVTDLASDGASAIANAREYLVQIGRRLALDAIAEHAGR